MSIPPLVCSTPPPPEQCEDDKDHEDFDLPYNLSQEDYEDSTEYTYGNYTTYDPYQTKTETVKEPNWQDLSEQTESVNKCSVKDDINSSVNITPIGLDHENTSKVEEAVIEDLNLIVDKDNIDSIDVDQSPTHNENKDDINNSESSDTDSRIKDQGGTSDAEPDDLPPPLVLNECISEPYSTEDICDKDTQNVQVCPDVENILEATLPNENVAEKTAEIEQFVFSNRLLSESINKCKSDEVNTEIDNVDDDDDFGDFEDFQFTNTQNTQVLPITIENPWDDRNSVSPAFVEFKANFDNTETNSIEDTSEIHTIVEDHKVDNVDDDDDFGDFDDFKSSENNEGTKVEAKDSITPNVSVFDVSSQDNELQICESISSLLAPIFTEEITEPENEMVGKLESFLSETWGHLIDIDVRQPYMINWNNSLGQKTLLKALCIDSRNILFGPKWQHNMPKYAANLSAAPLQPKKQVPQSNTANTETSERTNKEANTWIDPFTPDGQEYTYAEALLLDLEHLMATLDQMAHKHSTLKISELLSHACNTENENAPESAKRPTDLDVFGEAPAQLNKIYSSTIKVQPVRHINLPDTHIFTPTDSETPRSKTIHYDTEPNPVPIPIADNNKMEAEKITSEPTESVDNEYWEFQDFKAPSSDVPNDIEIRQKEIEADRQPLPSITYQTQILQPIKMEPVITTLNWPDPGEVKETFDDFSDFMSNSAWSSDKGNNSAIADKKVDVPPTTTKGSNDVNVKSEHVDDDFETFQSAPAATVTNDTMDTFTSVQNFQPNVVLKNLVDGDNKSPILIENKEKKFENSVLKVENKSPSLQKGCANDSMFKQMSNMNSLKHMNADILQPTNASTSGLSRSQQSSGQILQPLSLEGYSQINWPNPGIDLQDLSRFNPVDSVHTIKNEVTASGNSKGSSPAHSAVSVAHKEISDDDIWGDFVSSAPKPQQATPKKMPTFLDDDEWTDFVSSPSVKPINGLSTISLNVHTNLNMQKSNTNKLAARTNQLQLDIPQLNYITPKSNSRGIYTEKHFQNL